MDDNSQDHGQESSLWEIIGTDLLLLIWKFKTQDLEKLEQLFQGHTTLICIRGHIQTQLFCLQKVFTVENFHEASP